MTAEESDGPASDSVRKETERTERESGLRKLSAYMDRLLQQSFAKLAGHIADRPFAWIMGALFLTVIFASGFSQYEQEGEPTKLWTPQGTESLMDKDWVEATFGPPDRRQALYFVPGNGGDGRNVVTVELMLAFLDMWEWVEKIKVPYEDRLLTYSGLCAQKGDGTCKPPRSILNVWNYSRAVIKGDPDPLATLNSPAARESLRYGGPPLEYYIGGVKRDASGRFTSVGAVRLLMDLENNLVYSQKKGQHDPVAAAWEVDLGSGNGRKFPAGVDGYGSFYYISRGFMDQETSSAIQGDIFVVPLGYALSIFYCLAVLWHKRRKHSHLVVGIAGVVSVGMATVSAYGLALWCGVKYNTVNSVLVLVLLGIGVDDTFVIFDGWLNAGWEKGTAVP
eukprot:Hpha_TRINITY_DN26210_c0_g1::TRINITY_DN26210_c0_g1_i1::g.184791::m.184791